MNFARLAEHKNKNQGGTGLGLSICKQIIEKMGGSVTVVSEEGVGTEFKIKLTLISKVSI
jgi:signal transduction histidine kinase